MAGAEGSERERWQRVQGLFHRARELAPEERAAFLRRQCAGDATLLAEVLELVGEALPESWSGERPAQSEDLSGRRFGHYELERVIGQGSMGVIYEARQERVGRSVALKVLRGRDEFLRAGGTPRSYERMARRFAAEAEALGLLDHPGIVPIHELESADGHSYFTMRLVRGEDFRSIIARVHARGGREGWTLARALGVVLRVCETMAFAHDRGVLHRDLKPSHVMVGAFGEVTIVDWGLARLPGRAEERDLRLAPEQDDAATDSLAPEPLRTVEGDVIGTPAYMPPEQARGELERLGTRSDVYALGALVYHLLAGHPPYLEEPLAARRVLERVRSEAPLPLAGRAPGAAPALVAICEKAMRREPEERYAGMQELALDLRAFLENRVVGAHRTGRLTVLVKWLQRNALLAAAAGVLGLVGIGWATSVAWKNRALAAAAREASRERDHARVESGFSEATVRFLMDVFRSLHPDQAQGREVSMRDALDLAAESVAAYRESPRVEAAVRRTLGVAYHHLGDGARAEPHLRFAAETLERELGARDAQTVGTLGELGAVLRELARYDEAEPLLRRTLALAGELQGERGLLTLRAMGNLGQLLFDRRQLEEALALARRLAELQTAVGGPASPELPPTYELIGSILDELGRPEEAEAWFRKELELDRTLHGEDHSSTLVAAQNLANVLSGMGRREEALELALGTVARLVEVFGPTHRNALIGQGNLALYLVDDGQVEEGLALLRETLATQEEVQGPEHPDTLQTRFNLAKILRFRQRTDEALPLYLALDAWHKARGDGADARHGIVLVGLADSLMAAGDDERAVGVLRRLLPLHRAHPERTEATLADTGRKLAGCYRALGWQAELEGLEAELAGGPPPAR